MTQGVGHARVPTTRFPLTESPNLQGSTTLKRYYRISCATGCTLTPSICSKYDSAPYIWIALVLPHCLQHYGYRIKQHRGARHTGTGQAMNWKSEWVSCGAFCSNVNSSELSVSLQFPSSLLFSSHRLFSSLFLYSRTLHTEHSDTWPNTQTLTCLGGPPRRCRRQTRRRCSDLNWGHSGKSNKAIQI